MCEWRFWQCVVSSIKYSEVYLCVICGHVIRYLEMVDMCAGYFRVWEHKDIEDVQMVLKTSKVHKCRNMRKCGSMCVEQVHTHHQQLFNKNEVSRSGLNAHSYVVGALEDNGRLNKRIEEGLEHKYWHKVWDCGVWILWINSYGFNYQLKWSDKKKLFNICTEKNTEFQWIIETDGSMVAKGLGTSSCKAIIEMFLSVK